MKTTPYLSLVLLVLAVGLAGCGGRQTEPGPQAGPNNAAADASGLTPEQLEKGIGPVTHVELGPLDEALAARGEELFRVKCSACHKLDQRYIGPPLGDVTSRRSPEFIMNMILNPTEMVQKHPVAKQLLAEYLAPMADQSLTEEEARAILEYFRKINPGQGG
ncbi:cytochrome c [Rhodocaloribacter litoris]|uniref:c-type cytochrome n=1 Tax=Rhodocaloribacter litoris TaxID=2558931 RepID=UPI00141EDEA0|nr:cytochrome c [Rhodocaloribacter litoris]QXD16002.1 cytochrome c [Rhodocaloribacter litoris]